MKKLSIAMVAVLTGCAPMAEMIQNAGQPTVKTVSTTQPSIDQAQLEAYNGPKAESRILGDPAECRRIPRQTLVRLKAPNS